MLFSFSDYPQHSLRKTNYMTSISSITFTVNSTVSHECDTWEYRASDEIFSITDHE